MIFGNVIHNSSKASDTGLNNLLTEFENQFDQIFLQAKNDKFIK